LSASLQDAQSSGLLAERCRQVALDSTGYENGHTSVYYGQRCGQRKRRFPKFTALCDTRSHLYVSGVMSEGPAADHLEFREAVVTGFARIPFDELLADAGYDSEANHVLVRSQLVARSIIPPSIGRPTARPPTGDWRRRLAQRFPHRRYGQRWQIESCFSQDKRRFGSSIEGRDYGARCRKLYLRLVVHNLALILRRFAGLLLQRLQSLHHPASFPQSILIPFSSGMVTFFLQLRSNDE